MGYTIRWIDQPDTRLSPFLPAVYTFEVLDENQAIASYPDQVADCSIALEGKAVEGLSLYANEAGRFSIDLQPSLQAISIRASFLDSQQPTLQSLLHRHQQRHPFYADRTLAWLLVITVTMVVGQENVSESLTLQQTLLATTPIDYRDQGGPLAHRAIPYPRADRVAHAVYFRGYPFDLPLLAHLSGQSDSEEIILSLDLSNKTIGQSFLYEEFGNKDAFGLLRLQISDGLTDIAKENYLHLTEGANELEFTFYIGPQGQHHLLQTTYLLHVRSERPGIYLRWLNSAGSYSYWLFNRPRSISVKTKSALTFDQTPVNLASFRSKSAVTAVLTTQTVELISQPLTHEQSLLVREIFTSPSVELYAGKPYQQASPSSWVAVDIQDGEAKLWQTKNTAIEYKFKINVPTPYLQAL